MLDRIFLAFLKDNARLRLEIFNFYQTKDNDSSVEEVIEFGKIKAYNTNLPYVFSHVDILEEQKDLCSKGFTKPFIFLKLSFRIFILIYDLVFKSKTELEKGNIFENVGRAVNASRGLNYVYFAISSKLISEISRVFSLIDKTIMYETDFKNIYNLVPEFGKYEEPGYMYKKPEVVEPPIFFKFPEGYDDEPYEFELGTSYKSREPILLFRFDDALEEDKKNFGKELDLKFIQFEEDTEFKKPK